MIDAATDARLACGTRLVDAAHRTLFAIGAGDRPGELAVDEVRVVALLAPRRALSFPLRGDRRGEVFHRERVRYVPEGAEPDAWTVLATSEADGHKTLAEVRAGELYGARDAAARAIVDRLERQLRAFQAEAGS